MGTGGCVDAVAVQGTAVELFHLASLLMGDQLQAVALVEETLASIEIDPCFDPAAARGVVRHRMLTLGLRRLREMDPASFAGVPAGGNPVCVEDEDLSAAGISQAQLTEWLASAGRQDLRDWLAALPGAQRAIFVQRAVLGQGNMAVAEALNVSGAVTAGALTAGAQGEEGRAAWSAIAVGEMYRLALCSLANSLAHSPGVLRGVEVQGVALGSGAARI